MLDHLITITERDIITECKLCKKVRYCPKVVFFDYVIHLCIGCINKEKY